MNYNYDECVAKLIEKYWMLRERYIKEELEETVSSLLEDGMDINNETVLDEFNSRMEYNFREGYFLEEITK